MRPQKKSVFEELSLEECLARLALAPVGRIALSLGALPVILPVMHVMLDGDVVFTTGSGTKLAAATIGTVVAFEVDHYDGADDSSWSVLVQGVAEEIVDPVEVQNLPLAPWPVNETADHYVRIRAARISGRQYRQVMADDLPNT